MLTKFDKAFAALVVAGVVPIVNHLFGFQVSVEMQAVLSSILSSVVVYLVPNKT